MITLIEKLFVFLVLMVIGYLCGRTGYISKQFTTDASKLVINIFMSGTIINSVLTTNSASGINLPLGLFVMSMAVLVSYIVSWILVLLLRIPKEQRGKDFLLMGVGNTVFIGMPVAETFYGSIGVFYIALSNIMFNVLLYTWGLFALSSDKGEGRMNPKNLLTPPLLVTLLSMVIFLLHIRLPHPVVSLIGALSQATMPLSMFIIGASMAEVSIADTFRHAHMYLLCAIRLILVPVIVCFVSRLLTSDPVLIGSAVICLATPAAVIITVLSIREGYNPVYTSETILLSTLLSMLTIPLIVAVLL